LVFIINQKKEDKELENFFYLENGIQGHPERKKNFEKCFGIVAGRQFSYSRTFN